MGNKKTKLNTDLDDSLKSMVVPDEGDIFSDADPAPVVDDDLVIPADVVVPEEESADGEITYSMGDILYADDSDADDDDKQILQVGTTTLKAEEEEDEDEDWTEDEINMDDTDPFLDDADFDPEENGFED